MFASKFGLHKDNDGVWWLMQDTLPSNAIGIPKPMCEIPEIKHAGRCPHHINLEDHQLPDESWEEAHLLPLVQFFQPIPREDNRLAFLPVKMSEMELRLRQLSLLQMMFSPICDMMLPAWTDKQSAAWFKRRSNSNLATIIIFGDLIVYAQAVDRLKQLSYQLGVRVLFLGPEKPDEYGMSPMPALPEDSFEALESAGIFDQKHTPDTFRSYGAHLIWEFMRK